MIIKELEDMLRDYKSKKSELEIIEARIVEYEEIIKDPSKYATYIKSYWNIGIKVTGGLLNGLDEKVMSNEEMQNRLEEWIDHDKSLAFGIRSQVKRVEILLNSLNDEDRYIIDLKYIEKLGWEDIERNYNEFRRDKGLTISGLKKKNSSILRYLLNIINKK